MILSLILSTVGWFPAMAVPQDATVEAVPRGNEQALEAPDASARAKGSGTDDVRRNEGVRGTKAERRFSKKLQRKIATWTGPALGKSLQRLERKIARGADRIDERIDRRMQGLERRLDRRIERRERRVERLEREPGERVERRVERAPKSKIERRAERRTERAERREERRTGTRAEQRAERRTGPRAERRAERRESAPRAVRPQPSRPV